MAWRFERGGTFAPLVLVALALFFATPSRAEPGDPSATRAAAEQFARGEKAYKLGDFAGAAQAFEEAYRLSPHVDSLWNAARAWQRAAEPARAANLFAKYLRSAATDARDRGRVEKALRELAVRLGRLEITAPSGARVWVDQSPVDAATMYVTPGTHEVRIVDGDRDESMTATVEAGASVSVAAPSRQKEPASTPSAAPTRPIPAPPKPEPSASTGWSPVVVVVGAGVTALVIGLTVWSGIDTLEEREAFDDSPTRESYDRGRSKQTRTNIGIGVSIALTAITAATAIWLVDWGDDRGSAPSGLTLAPSGVGYRAVF